MATLANAQLQAASGRQALVAGALFISTVALCAVAWPLATYALSLAAFGFVHVLSELHYVHRRYGSKIHRRLASVLGLLLGAVVLLRVATLAGVIGPQLGGQLEVGVALMLGILVLPLLGGRHRLRLGVGVLICAALAAGLLVSAMHTLLVLAILHNFTPIGFLADATRGRSRKLVLAACVGVFVVVPAFIATGIPFSIAADVFGLAAPDASPLPVGPLAAHLGAYLPPELHGRSWTMHAFSAVVFTQCMHYAVVIHVLPRLQDESAGDGDEELRVGRSSAFAAFLVVAGAVWLAAFYWDFRVARSLYGITAAVHAWIEIPILMVALLGVWPTTAEAKRTSG